MFKGLYKMKHYENYFIYAYNKDYYKIKKIIFIYNL